MRWLRARWWQFWFEAALPTNLGLCRVLFYGALFMLYLPDDFSAWATVSKVFWEPIWPFQRFHLPLLPSELLTIVQVCWKAALGLSCIGFCTRFSTVGVCLLGPYLLGLRHNFGETSHQDAILVFVFGILALSRCGDGVSVDALMRAARRGHDASRREQELSGEYTWPIRMVWLVMALVFFAAGVAKLRLSGLGWIRPETMTTILIVSNYQVHGLVPLTSWGVYLAHYPWLCGLLAAATVAIEVGFPLALVSRKARWLLVPADFLMQIGIRLLIGPSFVQFMVCYLFWIRWDRVARWVAAWLHEERRLMIPAWPVSVRAEAGGHRHVSVSKRER
jgi:hypothetical protein